jgi:microcystin-dependent protein
MTLPPLSRPPADLNSFLGRKWLESIAQRLTDAIEAVDSSVVPVGTILETAAATPDDGFLFCDGSAVSRATYSDLYNRIGTIYGSGDGSSTFNLPDKRGKFSFGKAASGTGSTIGTTFGTIDHDHTSPAHVHSVPAHWHAHDTSKGSNYLAGPGIPCFVGVPNGSYTLGSAGTAYRDLVTGDGTGGIGNRNSGIDGNSVMASGSTAPANTGSNNPPALVTNFQIRF